MPDFDFVRAGRQVTDGGKAESTHRLSCDLCDLNPDSEEETTKDTKGTKNEG